MLGNQVWFIGSGLRHGLHRIKLGFMMETNKQCGNVIRFYISYNDEEQIILFISSWNNYDITS